MPRRQKKYHFIYKTTCIITEKFYIGMHSTDDLEDGYVGSGKRLWYSINKYGKENHNVEILEFLENRKALKEREKEIINEELLLDKQCMNLALGGEGGGGNMRHQFTKDQLSKGGKSTCKIIHERLKTDIEFKKFHSRKVSEGLKKNIKENGHWWTDRKHKEEAKKRIGEKSSVHQKGEGNSQFGTCWIHNLELKKCKKIKKDDLSYYLDKGWIKGRKMKF